MGCALAKEHIHHRLGVFRHRTWRDTCARLINLNNLRDSLYITELCGANSLIPYPILSPGEPLAPWQCVCNMYTEYIFYLSAYIIHVDAHVIHVSTYIIHSIVY